MIIGRYLLTILGIDLRLSENNTYCDNGLYWGCSETMVYIHIYDFEFLNGKILPQS